MPFPREYATVFDVGANRGQFAVFALRRFPGAQIFCFEPLPSAHEVLSRVVGHDPRVLIAQVAVGAVEGRLALKVARRDDSSSLLKPTALQMATFRNTFTVSSVEVSVRRLDDVIEAKLVASPFLLKIDVQGFELEVLTGASALLSGDGDVLVEASFAELYDGQAHADEVVAEMLRRGYRLCDVSSISRDANGSALQADFLFTK